MTSLPDYNAMLKVAVEEARKGLAEGGIPIGAALFTRSGQLLGAGHNRRVQENDPSVHAETDAFRKAGRQRNYRDKVMVTTLAPCWYCSGLILQFKIGTVVVGESENFTGGVEWLQEKGVEVIDLRSRECVSLLADYISNNPEVWNEDIGRSESVAVAPQGLARADEPMSSTDRLQISVPLRLDDAETPKPGGQGLKPKSKDISGSKTVADDDFEPSN